MATRPVPVRTGRPVCFTLDHDAEALLRAMAPHSKGLGRLVGELLRKEAERRAERATLLKALTAMSEADAGISQEIDRAIGE